MNRIGNLVVPNENYCRFEDWVIPILDKMLDEQRKEGVVWSPSSVIRRLGKEIDNEESVYYWAYKVSYRILCVCCGKRDVFVHDELTFISLLPPFRTISPCFVPH